MKKIRNIIAVLICGVLFILVAAGSTGSENIGDDYSGTKEDYVAKCEKYTYEEVARNPETYKGKNACFMGKVIQVQENSSYIILRVDVTKGEYGFWSDTIYVTYKYSDKNESRILEDDIITLYGEIKGIKTYTSVLGSSVSIPEVRAYFVDIEK